MMDSYRPSVPDSLDMGIWIDTGAEVWIRHAREEPVPVEALLDPDPELRLVWAPLVQLDTSCQYQACESDAFCTCQEGEPE